MRMWRRHSRRRSSRAAAGDGATLLQPEDIACPVEDTRPRLCMFATRERLTGEASVVHWMRRCRKTPLNDQMHVPEFVPQIVALERDGVRLFQRLATGDRFEHREMRRTRLVKSGQQSIDDAHAALGCDHEIRPTA